jgi:two-component system cell cycle sensor histidine kinase/response regulator CckA
VERHPITTIMNALFQSLRGTGWVLVMDDEKFIRAVDETILEALGYQVETAEEGSSAVRCYAAAQAAGRPFEIVILDLTIPVGPGGRKTMKQIWQMDPTVKAIVSSRHADDPVMERYYAHGFCAVLHKTYQIEDLERTVHQAIRRARRNALFCARVAQVMC